MSWLDWFKKKEPDRRSWAYPSSTPSIDNAQAIVVRIVQTGGEDPWTVTAHLEDKWVDLVRKKRAG